MIVSYIFAISGLFVLFLIATKKIEEKQKKPLLVSRLISKGDIHTRRLHHTVVHFYSEIKDRATFFFKKQIPIHSRNSLNKTVSFLKEKRGHFVNNMRDSKLLKKSDGISEFFKNISEVEKGNGAIHDSLDEDSQN